MFSDLQTQEGAGDGTADFLISNWQQQQFKLNAHPLSEGAAAQGDNDGKDGEKQSAHSFGTGSFTTNTFNARLAGSHGMEILHYVQSEDFGKYGESIKLIANINEFMNKLALENQRLEEENNILSKSNEQF
mmetsp:Transcript_10986/g.14852  ORF Transcript_10986/g.14852 Transcript_10986/m.14852 type:complete len:131 (-) Transcript_10986:1006-1398(-)